MRLRYIASVAVILAAGALAAPLSKPAAVKIMHERHEGMEAIGKANKVLRREVAAENVAGVRPAARTMAQLAARSGKWFPPGTGPEAGKTAAKAEIWQKRDDFAARLRDFQGAAKALDAAARAGDLTKIKAGYASLGQSCKACHDSYRAEMQH